MHRLPIIIPDPMKAALDAQAKKTGLTVSEIVRRAIDAYLAKQK
jgi:predicted DNA-binding protein